MGRWNILNRRSVGVEGRQSSFVVCIRIGPMVLGVGKYG
jgi:hypothetical protein